MRGRDVEEKETALVFAGGFWSILGEAADVRRSGDRVQIIAALTDHGEPMAPVELATATGKRPVNVRQLLFKMAKAGEVHKAGGGRYWIEPPTPPPPRNTDNVDNASLAAGPADIEPQDGTSRRHKCWHCHERGETLEVVRGIDKARLHRQCIDAWVAEHDESNGGE